MPEDVSQVTEILARLSSSNNNDVIEITAEAFDVTFPLRQRSSTRFHREIEAVKVVTTPAPQHQQVAGSKKKHRRNDKLDKEKGRAVNPPTEDARDLEENDEEVHLVTWEDEGGSDSQDSNPEHSASAGDESGGQGEDLQEEEGISEDDQNQEGQDHSPLQSPDSESEPREVEKADHGITAGPNPLLD
ncbi:hypothetical protein L873DRAFT_1796555 [Choiromyces venosus 120613-1]|uniref:Uncharacterized protein n=1 Tax=Choiromyces venosus 120613-1 TaxID=1336337 RepID=A0A3N4IV22_9PEZI|nr:hypothetical protein L873DRAFT_1796555 [Choiromyces venosus 120613-1]